MTPTPAFASRLKEQIANEFAAHQQYVACAVYYDSQALPQLAGFFYRQGLEEREHAMMIIQFLLDTSGEVTVPGVKAPLVRFGNVVEPISLALEQEQRVSEQINVLAATARQEGDYTSEQFVQWFIREQIEEVATMTNLLRVAERCQGNEANLEDFIAREHQAAEAPDLTAPRAAGSR